MIIIYSLFLLFTVVLGILILKTTWERLKNGPAPPGPPRKPLIGNMLDAPPEGCKEWEHWLKHKELYGPISSLEVLGQTIIIVNNAKVANDLLDKKSAFTSSRPQAVITHELIQWDRMVTLQSDPNKARVDRKHIMQMIGTQNSLSAFSSQLETEARRFLLRMLEEPQQVVDHIRRQVGSIILTIVYGYTVASTGEDSLVELADKSTSQFSLAVAPGSWLVDSAPILKYLPAWFPGASFQHKVREWKQTLDKLADKPYSFVVHQMAKDHFKPSYVSKHLEQLGRPPNAQEQHTIKWTAATMYGAGADTTVSAASTFFILMAIYPDFQQKAQQEISRVVGSSRLPNEMDRNNLPYVNALIKEVLRWHPVAPLGVPHATTDECECEGYRIPKGCTIIPNIWAIAHDPETYHDSTSFNPERFLTDDRNDMSKECDPHRFVFGFGRRVCPGRFLAETTLFLIIAKSLAVFNIRKPVDQKTGKYIEPKFDFSPGIISHPTACEVIVESRGVNAEKLIRAIEVDNPWPRTGDSDILNEI